MIQTRVTEPLREEHRELFPEVERLREAAQSVGQAPPAELARRAEAAYAFLAHHLIPHAEAEERALYPVVQRVMGAPRATATMSRDHAEVGRLTAELGGLVREIGTAGASAEQAEALRRVLYGLYALVHVHFAKEEEIYLPLLDQALSAAEAGEMFDAMEAAAGEAKARSA
jgi:iron-sulfur cluster repair protein YtfE (RIC family)